LQMSLQEVEKLLGKPDFSTPRLAARLASTPEPKEQQCRNQVASILKKSSENMVECSSELAKSRAIGVAD
jgi:hypothetical protein